MVKSLPASAGDIRDADWIPGSGRSPGGGHGNPLQRSCLQNPTDRGAWPATVHGVAESQRRLSTHARQAPEPHSLGLRLQATTDQLLALGPSIRFL